MVSFDLLGLDAVSGQIAAGENARVSTLGTEGFPSNAAGCFGVGRRSTCLQPKANLGKEKPRAFRAGDYLI